ncbi:transglutaminase domain-containing protein [Winogradskyella litorisediminis]|uniref:Transglutaminase domain-containing protein n=1 Tax=Winogradskyella litorisediminis TaxID=1156618 RepID=A0ABW3N6T1_9FLAO
MKKILLITILSAFSILSFSQDFRFGKVSKAELEEKTHPLEPSANAAVLYKKEYITFTYVQGEGFIQNREVQERIKIYNKEGYDWATEKVYLYQGSSGATKEKIYDIKGYTFNLIGGKVEKDKLKNDGIFKEELNEFTDVSTITMPNVKDGCVIEYTYTIKSPFSGIDDIYFQYNIPINELDIKVATPQYARYNKVANLRATYFPQVKERKEDRKVAFVDKQRSGVGVTNTNYSRSSQTYFDNVLEINEKNIPSLIEEAFVGSMENYISKMSFEMVATLNDYGAIEKSFSSSWESVSKTIYDQNSFGGQIDKDNFFKDDIATLTAGVENPFEKAAILNAFVKSKVKWNGIYGFTSSKGIKKAYQEGEGNIGDINLLLIAMLKSQGVNANPVLVSTRNNGIPLYPTRKGFNYVVCMVENEGQYVLIDASEIYSNLNVLPERTLNWQGRLVKEDGSSSWVSLSPSQQSQQSSSLNVKIEDDFSISGKVRQMITSNMALRYKRNYLGLSKDEQIKSIEKGKGAIEVSDTEIETKDNGAFSVSYDYELSDAIDEVGGKLYFSPLLFMAEKENPFNLDNRKYPIDFTMPIKDKNIVNIMLPQGYELEALPQSEVMKFKDGAVTYSFVAKQNGKFIQLSTEFDIKSPIIDSADYSVFKEFYGKVVEKQAEQIVLKKV